MVSKDTYSDWERSVIEYYNNNTRFTSFIIPRNKPSVVYKKKAILLLDIFIQKIFPLSGLAKLQHSVVKNIIPEKHKLNIYHGGKNKLDTVSYGLDDEKREILIPAIDVGGLTNGRWKLKHINNNNNKRNNNFYRFDPEIIFTKFLLTKNTTLTKDLIDEIYNAWLSVSGRNKFFGNIKLNLVKALISFKKTGHTARVAFSPMKKEKRIIVPARKVKKDLDTYYVREFGKGDNTFAKEPSPSEIKNLYCAITPGKFITPNINLLNLKNEYVTG